jgi:hypothetical protein
LLIDCENIEKEVKTIKEKANTEDESENIVVTFDDIFNYIKIKLEILKYNNTIV